MKTLIIQDEDRKQLSIAAKKIVGQMQSILNQIENGELTDQMLIQLLAVKGGASRMCKDLIAKGVVPQLKDYSEKEIDQALEIIFKL
jgi:DNA-binding FrmR family transcriptional regulator